MDAFVTDLRQALRHMRARPAFTLVAALSLAIGVGANVAIFSAANALLLRPVPGVAEPGRVVEVGRTQEGRGFDTFAYPDYLDWSGGVSAFETTSAFTYETFNLSRDGEGERITGMHVEPAYFDVMGVRPMRGRFFTPEENAPGSEPSVVVLSHAFWTNRLGGDPDIVGETIRINRVPFTVVGVAPEGFHGHTLGFRPDAYLPLRAMPLVSARNSFESRRASWHQAVARLAPGASVEQAESQVEGVYARLAEAFPETNERRGGAVVPLGLVPGGGRGVAKAFVGVLAGLVGLILLVTCANVAGMFIARASAREREIAVRLALGSGRARLVRQLTTEALAVFVVGGGLGTLLGLVLMARVPIDRMPVPIPVHVDLSPDARVLVFALGTTLVTGLVFGLLPALQSTRLSLVAGLKHDGASRSGVGRLRRFFVTGQIGLSLVLLAAASLLLRSLQHAAETDAGFDPDGVVMTMVDLSREGYTPAEGLSLQTTMMERLQEMPGVEAAGISIDLPLDLGRHGNSAYPEGWRDAQGREGLGVDFNVVSPGYFQALRIPVLSGRVFGEQDTKASEPVIVVSRAFADRIWPGESALGRRVRFGSSTDEPRTVVGVTDDVKNAMITDGPEPFVYVPAWQSYTPATSVVVRTRGSVEAAPLVRGALLEVDPSLALTPVIGLDRYTAVGLLPQRLAASIASVLGALALLLSAIGIYGVITVTVAQRRREIGVRMALGAGRRSVLVLMVQSGLRLAIPGLAVGALVALAAGRGMGFLLLGSSPTDPVALSAVALLLLLVVLLASFLPARRAAAVQPVEALRAE